MIRRYLLSSRFAGHLLLAATVLLCVIWYLSVIKSFEYILRPGSEKKVELEIAYGTIFVEKWEGYPVWFPAGLHISTIGVSEISDVTGRFCLSSYERRYGEYQKLRRSFDLAIPIPCLILVTGAATYLVRRKFRFSLWLLLNLITLTSITIAWYGYWQPYFARN